MIIVTLRMAVIPQKRSDFIETIRGLLEPTRVEAGCKGYYLYQDIEDENTFILIEEWETKTDLSSHIHKDSYRKLLALMDLLSEPPEIKFNTVSHSEGMEYVAEVLGLHR